MLTIYIVALTVGFCQAGKPIKWLGWSPADCEGTGCDKTLDVCEGDCDTDTDCVGTLKCMSDKVPNGCSGSLPAANADICYAADVATAYYGSGTTSSTQYKSFMISTANAYVSKVCARTNAGGIYALSYRWNTGSYYYGRYDPSQGSSYCFDVTVGECITGVLIGKDGLTSSSGRGYLDYLAFVTSDGKMSQRFGHVDANTAHEFYAAPHGMCLTGGYARWYSTYFTHMLFRWGMVKDAPKTQNAPFAVDLTDLVRPEDWFFGLPSNEPMIPLAVGVVTGAVVLIVCLLLCTACARKWKLRSRGKTLYDPVEVDTETDVELPMKQHMEDRI